MDNNLLEEFSIDDNKQDSMIIFDETDKPFLLFYLIIFVLGIILTLIAI
jgi:heme/copper-type cytochrome/quinol oxidase subunit 4